MNKKETEYGIIKMSRNVALISFIIGTLILLTFYLTENTLVLDGPTGTISQGIGQCMMVQSYSIVILLCTELPSAVRCPGRSEDWSITMSP